MIIGIAGKKQSGKDEVAKILYDYYAQHSLFVKRVGFADELKADLARLCGVSISYLEQHKEEFRQGMQWYGQLRRQQRTDYWISRYLNCLSGCLDSINIILTPDVRHINEFDCIKNKKGFIFKVERKQFELGGHKEIPSNQPPDTHISEIALDELTNFDCVIDNSGTLEQLKKEVLLKIEMYKILCINPKIATH